MLNKYSINKDFKELISEKLPKKIIQDKPGKGDLKYISGYTVVDILNKLCNYNWDWIIEKEWLEEGVPFYNKYDNKTEEQGPVAHVRGTLVMHFVDDNGNDVTIKKSAYGAKPIIGKQDAQKDIFKSASTDALKKAASYLGVAGQLYREKSEQEYFEDINYEDPWDDETLLAHKEEFDYLKSLIADKTLTAEELAEEVRSFTDGELSDYNDLLPEELTDFVAELKASA